MGWYCRCREICPVTGIKKGYMAYIGMHWVMEGGDLMDGDAVGVRHLVKFIDAHDAAVGQHHGARLQPLLT